MEAEKKHCFPNLLQQNVARYGITWKYAIMGSQSLFTVDPENIKATLATEFEDLHFRPIRIAAWCAMLSKGIFTQDGHGWMASRDLMRPQFARYQISNIEMEEKHVQNLMRSYRC